MHLKLPSINMVMFIYKYHYFVYQAGIAPAQTAMPVYAKTLGFSSFVVGTVWTVLPLASLVMKPIFGALADKFKLHKIVMLAIAAVTGLSYFCVQFLPSPVDESPGLADADGVLPDDVTYSKYQYYVFVALMVGGLGGTACTTTLSDTLCIAQDPDPDSYGKQRLWGSVGYGVVSIITGLIIDGISVAGQPKNYQPVFWLTIGILALDIVVSYFYIKAEIKEESQNIGIDVVKMVMNVRVLVFLVWCAAMGVSMGLTWTFLYLLLEDLAVVTGPDTVASIKTIEGLTNGAQTFLGETPAFFFSGWVISKLGHGHTMTVILFTIGVRFLCYSYLTNPWFTLFVEPLQLYYGLFYSTMTSYANAVAPPGTEATVQSIMCAVCEGIGIAIGGFVGGILYNTYGGNMCFRIFSIAFFIMAVINEGIEFIYRQVDKRKPTPPTIT